MLWLMAETLKQLHWKPLKFNVVEGRKFYHLSKRRGISAQISNEPAKSPFVCGVA
jgi:hypothetical protein